MIVIGDVHGAIGTYLDLLANLVTEHISPIEVFQVGDMGLGFDGVNLPELKNHRFIRGNHDDPALCAKHPNYAGDFGYKEGLFWLGGAYSIDKSYRLAYEQLNKKKVWWEDEEISDEQLETAFRLYRRFKPKTVITHDGPDRATLTVLTQMQVLKPGQKKIETRTGKALQRMFEVHQPDQWLFGHYHFDTTFTVMNTKFTCINSLSTCEIS